MRARGDQHAVGRTPLVRARRSARPDHARRPPRRCTSRRSCRWTSSYRISWTVPGARPAPAHRRRARGTQPSSTAISRSAPGAARPASRALHACCALPALAAARLGWRSTAQALRAVRCAAAPLYRVHPSTRGAPMHSASVHRDVRVEPSPHSSIDSSGGTLELVDPAGAERFGDDDRASAATPSHGVTCTIRASTRRAPPRGQRRARRVVRRRLVGHRRPRWRSCASRTATSARTHTRARPRCTAGSPRSSIPCVRRRARPTRTATAQRPRALRPRQRVLPADPRRDDDVLLRRLRRGRT